MCFHLHLALAKASDVYDVYVKTTHLIFPFLNLNICSQSYLEGYRPHCTMMNPIGMFVAFLSFTTLATRTTIPASTESSSTISCSDNEIACAAAGRERLRCQQGISVPIQICDAWEKCLKQTRADPGHVSTNTPNKPGLSCQPYETFGHVEFSNLAGGGLPFNTITVAACTDDTASASATANAKHGMDFINIVLFASRVCLDTGIH